jgi:hypothetical protein
MECEAGRRLDDNADHTGDRVCTMRTKIPAASATRACRRSSRARSSGRGTPRRSRVRSAVGQREVEEIRDVRQVEDHAHRRWHETTPLVAEHAGVRQTQLSPTRLKHAAAAGQHVADPGDVGVEDAEIAGGGVDGQAEEVTDAADIAAGGLNLVENSVGGST